MVVALAFGSELAAASRKPEFCIKDICLSTQFNSHSVTFPNVIWITIAVTTGFPSSWGDIHFTFENITINDTAVQGEVEYSAISFRKEYTTCHLAPYNDAGWYTEASLPESGDTFLTALIVPVPENVDWADASVTLCGNFYVISATPGNQADAQIAAAVYTDCSYDGAYPVPCETSDSIYNAGTPTGCMNNLIAGGTGNGNSDYTGEWSDGYSLCNSKSQSKSKSSPCLNYVLNKQL